MEYFTRPFRGLKGLKPGQIVNIPIGPQQYYQAFVVRPFLGTKFDHLIYEYGENKLLFLFNPGLMEIIALSTEEDKRVECQNKEEAAEE